MTSMLIISIIAGFIIGAVEAVVFLTRQKRKDDMILKFVAQGQVTINEAREWRETGVPPRRITSGALSPYD